MQKAYESWGRYPTAVHTIVPFHWRNELLTVPDSATVLPFGLGRSYGDSCLNDGQALLPTRNLRRFISFDPETGNLCCEAGVSLAEILDVFVPRGYFLPVTPGTKFVTVGGAIANDVHGKNHHIAGTFGHYVRRFQLLRSDGKQLLCSPEENAELFDATIGGLGLTGLILWAEIQLKPIPSRAVAVNTTPFQGVREFLDLSTEASATHEYLVAWVDSMSGKRHVKGLFMRGNHASAGARKVRTRKSILSVPTELPGSILNPLTIRLFNTLYYYSHCRRTATQLSDYEPFFYPLDSIANWNRIYGPHGFLQWQCLVPLDNGENVIQDILRLIARAGKGSFLTVMKLMGSKPAAGMMSFARPGITLAMDFPVGDGSVFTLLDSLDEMVSQAGGALYPAKDARMSAAAFQTSYPNWRTFARYIDPRFSSSLWRRVTNGTAGKAQHAR